MSNKRNKDRKNQALLSLSETAATLPAAVELNNIERLERGGLLTYLKSRWWIVGIIALLSLGALGAGLKYLEEDARHQMVNGKLKNGQNQSFLNRINPFLPAAPVVGSTHQLSKEYIYAGDRLLAVEDANATAVPPADVAVWRPTTGGWYIRDSSGQLKAAVGFGQTDDFPAPGDYDGDGKTDFCILRPDASIDKAKWFILKSSNGAVAEIHWGKDEDKDKPVQADYDGDGITDIAIIDSTQNPGQRTWVLSRSTNSAAVDIIPFGNSTDKTAPADYDGDGKADVAVWRDSTKSFYKLNGDSSVQTVSFAGFNLQQSSQEPVSGDYDGDGRADFAVRDGANWVILKSSDGLVQTVSWGLASDKAVQNDYDADGKVDIGVWRPSTGYWFVRQSTRIGQADEMWAVQWGQNLDFPVPVFYRR